VQLDNAGFDAPMNSFIAIVTDIILIGVGLFKPIYAPHLYIQVTIVLAIEKKKI
jgi:hypothetical protein